MAITFAVETREYRRYVRASTALVALGASMQESFKQVVIHLSKLENDTIELKQGVSLMDEELIIVRNILTIYSEMLKFQSMAKLFERIDTLKMGDPSEG